LHPKKLPAATPMVLWLMSIDCRMNSDAAVSL